MIRKFFITLTFISIGTFALAQEKGALRASGNLAYGFEVEELGFNLGAEYFITDNISGGLNFSIFFVEDPASFNEFNIDGRYYFDSGKIQPFALIGISNATSKFSGTVGGVPFDFKDSEVGLNIGGGAVFPISEKLGINTQLKYATPFDGQFVIQGGVIYRIL
ncbi:MAG: hypothetical protein RLN86_11080 [Cyclobacteriaceae bacterium]